MTASDTAPSTPDALQSASLSEPGWAAAETPPPEANGGEERASAYRQLWQPPGRRPGPRQALGGPFVWDGGQADRLTEPNGGRGHGTGRAERAIYADRGAATDRPAATDGTAALTGASIVSERAVIGDELRQLAAWCQMGSCIARHTDPAALGEVDIRAKAVASGWCVDLFGRLICPSCQQVLPVWSARPAVPRGRMPAPVDHRAMPHYRPAVPRDLPAAPGNVPVEQPSGSWRVGGAGFQIGRHRRTHVGRTH